MKDPRYSPERGKLRWLWRMFEHMISDGLRPTKSDIADALRLHARVGGNGPSVEVERCIAEYLKPLRNKRGKGATRLDVYMRRSNAIDDGELAQRKLRQMGANAPYETAIRQSSSDAFVSKSKIKSMRRRRKLERI